MQPKAIIEHLDAGLPWPDGSGGSIHSIGDAYATALAVASIRQARGELQTGYKIGFTNTTIWPTYNVHAPVWGAIWDSTLRLCDGNGEGRVNLNTLCQPRIEPEIVFGFSHTPAAGADANDIFGAIEWVAVGFEIVQSHMKDWKFEAPQAVADGSLHGQLLVGNKILTNELAETAGELDALLAQSTCQLFRGDALVDQGNGSDVLGSPLRALVYFLNERRQCPGARDIQPGDVVTTGTWTDAWPVQAGEIWSTRFGIAALPLTVHFE